MNPTRNRTRQAKPDWDDRLYAVACFVLLVSSPWLVSWALAL